MISLSTQSDEYDWHGFYTISATIREQEDDDETSHRTAINRMYYSVFNLVRAYARRRYGFWSEMNVHASLIKHFKMNSYDEYDSFCEDLQFLRDCRVQCDYDPQHINDSKGMMETCDRLAKRLIDSVDGTKS